MIAGQAGQSDIAYIDVSEYNFSSQLLIDV
jgi:hypothetical protein